MEKKVVVMKMKKKITFAEWNEIGIYNHAVKWLRPFCVYHLIKEGDRYKREQRIPLWFYLIIFIPAHLLQVLTCMWDGGLKEFEFADRYLGGDYLDWVGDPAWEKAKAIWDRK